MMNRLKQLTLIGGILLAGTAVAFAAATDNIINKTRVELALNAQGEGIGFTNTSLAPNGEQGDLSGYTLNDSASGNINVVDKNENPYCTFAISTNAQGHTLIAKPEGNGNCQCIGTCKDFPSDNLPHLTISDAG